MNHSSSSQSLNNHSQDSQRTASHSQINQGSPSELSAAATRRLQQESEDFQELLDDIGQSVGNYCRKRPLVASLAVFAAGFYVGWKVKPW